MMVQQLAWSILSRAPACLLVSVFLASHLSATAQQKVVFCATSITYNNADFMSAESCQLYCDKHTTDPMCSEDGRKGWKIDAVSPREIPEGLGRGKCNCVGQQYVFSKIGSSAPNRSDSDARELNLLKRENALLQQENKRLKADLDAIKKK